MGSDRYHERCTPPRYISIHAPRMGSDQARQETLDGENHFNPRPPRMGSDIPWQKQVPS